MFADAALIEANPDDEAVLATPPAVVTLRFDQGLDADKSSFRLIGPVGEVGVGRPAKDGTKVMALGDLALGPGEYTIKWTVGSEDGHLDRGTLLHGPRADTATGEPSPSAAPAASAAAVPVLRGTRRACRDPRCRAPTAPAASGLPTRRRTSPPAASDPASTC